MSVSKFSFVMAMVIMNVIGFSKKLELNIDCFCDNRYFICQILVTYYSGTRVAFGLLYRNIISDDSGPSTGCKSNMIMINILLNSFP